MSDPTPDSADRELRLQTYCLLAISILAAGITLWLLRPVLVPFVLALFFVIGLSPLLDLIQRRFKATRPAAIGVSFILGVFLISCFGLVLSTAISKIKKDRDKYEKGVEDTVFWGANKLRSVGIDLFPKKQTEDDEDPEAAAAAQTERDRVVEGVGKLASAQTNRALLWLGGALLDLMISLGVVLIFMFFLLAGASSEARPTAGLWAEIESKIRGYIVTKTIISFFTGLAFGIVLKVFGMEITWALVLGVLAFLLNFVPNVGPVIASTLPLPIVMFMMPDAPIWMKFMAVAGGVAVQVISGNVIEPKIMGESFELHPIVILLSLILWGIIWGPVGVLLAVPMTAAVKILLEKLEQTRPVAELLAGNLHPLEEAINREAQA